jgi:hypothetical protein
MCHCKHSVRIHLEFANIALEFLLEFGMRYPYLSFVIDKYCLFIRC